MNSSMKTSTPISTVVVDDEQASRDYLKELLESEEDFEVVACVGSSREAFNFLTTNQPECLFLDVEMPGMSGVGLCRSIDTTGTSIVFVTAFDQYAIDAFEINAIDYITKPIRIDRIRKSLARVRKNVELRRLQESLSAPLEKSKSKENLVLKAVRGQLVFHPSEIQFLESSGNYVKVWLSNRPHLVRETLNKLLEMLDSTQLIPIHRRYVVNVSKIRRVTRTSSGTAELFINADCPVLPVSRSKRGVLEEKLKGLLVD